VLSNQITSFGDVSDFTAFERYALASIRAVWISGLVAWFVVLIVFAELVAYGISLVSKGAQTLYPSTPPLAQTKPAT
jgi:hypothetical protein